MNFLSPAFLAGLPLLAVPVIIHLLSRRQQKKISWGAMRFLRQAATRRRRLWRLNELLLLILRTLAFLLFILALARPLLPVNWFGGEVPREVILVLDQSMSMSRKVGGSSFFEQEIELANRLLGELNGSDSVRVLLAGESPEWLTPDAIPASPSGIRALRSQLEQLKPTLGAGDLIACVREAADLEAPPDKSGRAIIVLSDGQKFGWRLDERPLWEAVQNRVKNSEIPTSVRLQFVPGAGEVANLCVNRIETARAFGAVNQALTFNAQIQNRGRESSVATLLEWRVNNESTGVMTVPPLAAGAATSISLSHQFTRPGLSEIACHLEIRDGLIADNDARLLVEIAQRLPVLLVEDAPSAETLESDTAFVLAALGAGKKGDSTAAWRSVFEPKVITSAQLEGTDLNSFRCVILADVRLVPPAAITKLESYAQSGGGVWITLGGHTETIFFNEHFYRGGLGLSPMKLTEAVGDQNSREQYFSLRAASESHPATALLSDQQHFDLDRARVYRRHQFDLSGGPDVSALLEVQPGDPVVVERTLERGRVLVQSLPLGLSWSTLPLCQAYVAMLHEWLWYLAEPGLPRRNLAAGEALIERANASSVSGDLTLPDEKLVPLLPEPASTGARFRFPGTRLPGLYTLSVNAKAPTPVRTKFLVQRNPGESDLKPWSPQDLNQFRTMKEFQFGTGLSGMSAGGRMEVPKHPLERWLLIALPFLLLAELLLAGWSTHRRNLRVEPVTMNA